MLHIRLALFTASVALIQVHSPTYAQDDYYYYSEEDSSDESSDDSSYDSSEDEGPDRYWAVRFGGDLGFAAIEHDNYIIANIVGLIRIGPVRADLGAPLLFRTDDFAFRNESWDDPRDFNRIGRCVRLDIGSFTTPDDVPDTGASCDPWGWAGHGLHGRWYFNARMSPIEDQSLGNGTLVSNFSNSLDLDRPSLGLRSDTWLSDYANINLFVDNAFSPSVLGGRGSFRPLQIFAGENWDETPDDMEVGITAVADLHAPLHLQTAFGRPLINDDGDLRFTTKTITAVGADFHYLYFWNLEGATVGEPMHGLYSFADYNRFNEVKDADGLHLGVRYVYKHDELGWDVRAGAEYRYIGNRYISGYFDGDYVTRSQKFGLNAEALALPGVNDQTTLLEYLQALPSGHTHGFQAYVQATFPIPTGEASAAVPLPVSAYIEGAATKASWSAQLSVGPFQMDQLVILGQYIRRNFSDISGIASGDGSLIRALGRFYFADPASSEPDNFLQYMHLDARFDHRFFLDREGEFRQTNDIQISIGFTAGT